MSNDHQIYTTFPVHKVESKNKINLDPGTPVEVFRNNTTAVEVIVKEVASRSKKKEQCSSYQDKTQTTESKHNKELDTSNETIEVMRKGFNTVINEMKRQLDELNQRNLDIQMQNLSLQLENYKLEILLQYKTHFIGKLRKEFQNMKHSLKFVIKSIGYISKITTDNVTILSETEYDDFEIGLKKGVKFAVYDGALSSGRSKDRISNKN